MSVNEFLDLYKSLDDLRDDIAQAGENEDWPNYDEMRADYGESASELADFAHPIIVEVWMFLNAWDEHTLCDLAERMTCRESDALADLIEAAGEKWKADALREAHAEADAPGDQHYKEEEEDDEGSSSDGAA